jgi:hypothetical protein
MIESFEGSENSYRRVSGIMLTAPNLPPKDIELVLREIQESEMLWKRSKARLRLGEMTGFKDGGLRACQNAIQWVVRRKGK